jgi:hypothetical protein
MIGTTTAYIISQKYEKVYYVLKYEKAQVRIKWKI